MTLRRFAGSILFGFICCISATTHALNPDGFERFTHIGHVYAQTVVTTSDGKPLWAEYNAQGGHSRLHTLDGLDGQVLPAMQVQSFFKLLNDFKQQYPEGVEIFTGSAIGGTLLTATGEAIQWPELPTSSATVVFPDQAQRFTTKGDELNKLVLPIDISSVAENQLQGQLTAFFNEHGQFVMSSPERIGRMTAFYLKDGAQAPADATEYQPASSLINLSSANYQLLNPIAGVLIEAISGYVDGYGVTDAAGYYYLQGRLSPCPGFAYFPEVYAIAKLNYASFNPRSSGRLPYYLTKTSYNTCNGYGAFPPGYTLGGLAAQQEVRAMVMMQPDNITRLNYPVAIQVINGSLMLHGAQIASDTQYSLDDSINAQYTMVQDDYDGDGTLDTTIQGELDAQGQFQASPEGNRYGVYFSSAPRDDGQPNLIRVMDIKPNVNHQGLLSSLSVEDFQKTDLLVFRASTGQLITQRVGLSADEINTADQRAYFQMAIRGPEDNHNVFSAQSSGWQAGGANNTNQPRAQDSLRPGEQVQIVAINRPSGYIGTTTAELTSTAAGGDIGVKLNTPIILSPPNLQIWASRRVQTHGLLSNSDEERYTISNEGAATTDDTLLEIHTQWLDQDGTPLPTGLTGYGYTGRLTKQIEHTYASDDVMDNRVNEFSIDPGRHMQVIRFDQQQPYHHYVQVNGYPRSEQNDFSSGDHSGALAHRPSRYVPLKAPLYNEQGSVDDRLALLNTEHDQRHTPKYHWVYRPELSFSVVDIQVNDILLKEHTDNTSISQSVLDNSYPVITGQEDLVEVLFSLISSEYDRITPLEGEQQYIFALGDNEIEVRIDKSDNHQEQQISFSNLDYLTHLKASDYLTLSLYLNQDSHNLLWNWAFTTLDVDLDEDNNNGTDLPDRSLLEEQIESISQHSGKRNFLNNGDVNNNGIPDFAEFEYTIVPEQTTAEVPQRGIMRAMAAPANAASNSSIAEHRFVPIVVEIPAHVDMTQDTTTITFTYEGSDPEAVKVETDKDGNKTYTPAPGNMRLWAKDASAKRAPKPYQSKGDYFTPEKAYKVKDLLGTNRQGGESRELVIYVEAIRATENRGAVLTTVLSYEHSNSSGITAKKTEYSINGLTNLEKPFQAVAALPQDTNLDLAYSVTLEMTPPQPQITLYTLGGVRLKLTYNLNSLTAEDRSRLDKITWSFNHKGRLCDDLKVLKDNKKADGKDQCTDLAANAEHSTPINKDAGHVVHWEPESWSNDLNVLLTTKTHYKEGMDTMKGQDNGKEITVPYPQITQTLAIKTRELAPQPAGQEYRGNDVKMLEQMLWQLGISPQHDFPGDEGTRLGEISGTLGGAVGGAAGKTAREVYSGGVSGVRGSGTLERMVRRFKGRNIATCDDSRAACLPIYNGVSEQLSGVVDNQTLSWLVAPWLDYYQAYSRHQNISVVNYQAQDIDAWISNATALWEDGNQTDVPITYTQEEHMDMLAATSQQGNATLTRENLIRAWKSQEAGTHWGKGHPATAHRITEGGGDEFGSIGFSQIKYAYRYGQPALHCGALQSQNLYDPADAIRGMIAFVSANRSAGNSNCGSSFYKGFAQDGGWRSIRNNNTNLRGYLQSNGGVATINTQRTDDAYELLMKAIAGYNGQGGTGNTWANMLTAPHTLAMGYGYSNRTYAIQVMRRYGILGRTYVWRGGVYENGHPHAGQEWCFKYGEEEWIAGRLFTDVRNAALDRNPDTGEVQIPQGRIACAN